jgi:hypothetical protein
MFSCMANLPHFDVGSGVKQPETASATSSELNQTRTTNLSSIFRITSSTQTFGVVCSSKTVGDSYYLWICYIGV